MTTLSALSCRSVRRLLCARSVGHLTIALFRFRLSDGGRASGATPNVRHEHEWRVWQEAKMPEEKILMPGVVSRETDLVEHPSSSPAESCATPQSRRSRECRRWHGLRPRRSGPRRPGLGQTANSCRRRTPGVEIPLAVDAGRRAVRKLRGRIDPSRAFGGIKGATTGLTAPAYRKFESISLQRRVSCELGPGSNVRRRDLR
jgi:hypothetical protein